MRSFTIDSCCQSFLRGLKWLAFFHRCMIFSIFPQPMIIRSSIQKTFMTVHQKLHKAVLYNCFVGRNMSENRVFKVLSEGEMDLLQPATRGQMVHSNRSRPTVQSLLLGPKVRRSATNKFILSARNLL